MKQTESKKTVKQFVSLLIETFQQSELTIYSAVITYYMLLSFFPLLLVIAGILPLLNLNVDSIYMYLEDLIPPDIYSVLYTPIEDLLTTPNNGLLSLSAIGTFWAVSKGLNGIRISLDQAYGLFNRKTQFFKRIVSFFMAFVLILTVLVIMFIMGFGQAILDYVLPLLGLPGIDTIDSVFQTFRWPVTFSILFVAFLFIYYFIPSAKVHLKSILGGTLFTTVGWLTVSQFFSFYVTHFSKNLSYGIIGGFILFILWLNIAASVIILGGVLNVTVETFIYGEIKVKKNLLGGYVVNKVEAARHKFEKKKEDKA